MNISIIIEDKDIQNRLIALSRHLNDMTPVMSRIAKWYEGRVGENFSNESAPDGTKWKPLSPITLMLGIGNRKGGFKKSGYLGSAGKKYLQRKNMLFQSGDLLRSIHSQYDRTSATIGSKGIRYAGIHQFGGQAGRRKKVRIPARPYLAMNSGNTLVLATKDRDHILGIIQEEIDGIISK